ncbi:Integrase core domain [Phytophthora infestans]|uniref:Integrase core domain n=1 Tax=Phytophthora infestans TaxID=4787 RepID=A0A833X2P4_PHYIN|nr:Integrase core domain [Phytophthora infestans]
MQPLPIPDYCWQQVTMDFVTGLPISNGYNGVLVVVDKLSKRPCYIPITKDVTAEVTAHLFFDHVVRYYGLPSSIVSDRDSKFCSKFWTALMEYMGIKLRMAVSKGAQADGQSERQIRTLKDALRCTASHYGDDWIAVLPTVECAHATAIHSSTQILPF